MSMYMWGMHTCKGKCIYIMCFLTQDTKEDSKSPESSDQEKKIEFESTNLVFENTEKVYKNYFCHKILNINCLFQL